MDNGLLHVGANPLRINTRRSLGCQAETIAEVIDTQGQRVVTALLCVHDLNPLPCRVVRLVIDLRHSAVAVIEQRIEQWRASRQGTAALGQSQLSVLMGEHPDQTTMEVEHCTARAVPDQIHAQWQGIDEHPQGALAPLTAAQPSKQHGAEYHAVTPGQLAEHLRPGEVHQRGGADTQLSCLIADLPAQVAVQRESGLARNLLCGCHGQAVRQGRLIDIAQLLAEERFMGVLARPSHNMGNVVSVRHRRCKLSFVVQQYGLQLMAQYVEGDVVHDHMVVAQHRCDPLVGRIMGINQLQQRRLRQVHARRIEQVLQGCLFNPQRRLAPDHLYRCLQTFPEQPGAQNIVALDHSLQRMAKSLETRGVGEGELRLQQIRIAVPGGQVVIKNTGLQRAQRVDILHISGTARHPRHDTLNGGLIQRYQGQQFRGDALAVRIDQVGWHIDFSVATDGLGQRRQRWLDKQNANVRTHVQTTHTRNQGHGQQRVAAQFKEIILTTDLLHMQQLGPQACQGDFDRSLRRFIGPAGDAVAVRCR